MRRRTLAMLALCACGPSHPPTAPAAPPPPRLHATIRWTGYGVPHILADDLGGAGFGQGYAAAKLELCRLADQFVRVRSERAKYFGAGDHDANLDSDFFHLHLGVEARAKLLIAAESDDARELAKGWVAGYDHYLKHTPPSQWPAPCQNAAWVQPIDELDLARLAVGLAATASSRVFADQIAHAAPDTGAALAPLPDAGTTAFASNAWALGADRTESEHGLLVANPHFPWSGDLTFREVHLTVKGDFDVYGAGIPGLPMVGIGFTRQHAWTHTFSSSSRFLLYRLRLVDGDPMRYTRDGADPERIVAHSYTIDVRKPDGTIGQASRTLYSCPLGLMVSSPQTPWDHATAWALHDAALEVPGSQIDQDLAFARAESLDDFRAAVAKRATPFLNTIYADVDGNAYYADGSNVPALSDQALAAWDLAKKAVPAVAAAWRLHVPVVDGSAPMFDTITDDPNAPGLVPMSDAPELLRRDYVMNGNDSWAFTNPAVQLGPYSPLYGRDDDPSPRTLMNLRMLREQGVASQAGDGGRFSRQEALAAVLSNRSFTGEQLRDDVLARCRAEVARRKKLGAKLQPLCTRLAEWDVRFGLASHGAMLWREFMHALAPDGEVPWTTAYDPAAPSTPSGLAPPPKGAPDPLIALLEQAADTLAAAGIDVRASSPTLGDVQHAAVGAHLAVPGGIALDGTTNVVAWGDADETLLPHASRGAVSATGLGSDGYVVDYGSSWLMAVDLLPDGPQADVLMTYGPPRADPTPGAPADPLDDQMARFAAATPRQALFSADDIARDPDLVTMDVIQDPP